MKNVEKVKMEKRRRMKKRTKKGRKSIRFSSLFLSFFLIFNLSFGSLLPIFVVSPARAEQQNLSPEDSEKSFSDRLENRDLKDENNKDGGDNDNKDKEKDEKNEKEGKGDDDDHDEDAGDREKNKQEIIQEAIKETEAEEAEEAEEKNNSKVSNFEESMNLEDEEDVFDEDAREKIPDGPDGNLNIDEAAGDDKKVLFSEETGEAQEKSPKNGEILSEEGFSETEGEDFLEKESVIIENVPEGAESENEENEILEEENILIETGNAGSEENALNNVNTNIVGQNGEDWFFNIFGEYSGDIDLVERFSRIIATSGGSAEDPAGSFLEFLIRNENEADVESESRAFSETGGNQAYSEEGDVSVSTGDAVSLAAIINFINRNFFGNNWLFASINIFGDWTGNLIVPGEGVLEVSPARDFSSVKIENKNSAEVENEAVAVSDSGGNQAFSESGEVAVSTGDAVSVSETKNIVGTNIVGNNWFFLLINNMGSWIGNIFGWNKEEGNLGIFQYNFGQIESEEENSPLSLSGSIVNENRATVKNVAVAQASTGGNSATSASGNASISTGNAWSMAGIFNMINTNIVGDNWFFAVVNNMGSWKGDVEFAHPDLEISLKSSKNSVAPGEFLDYRVEYQNKGKAGAKNSRIYLDFSSELIYNSGPFPESFLWEAGELSPGEKGSFSISLRAGEETPLQSQVMVQVVIATDTPELDLENNSDSDSVLISSKSSQGEDFSDSGKKNVSFGKPDSRLSIKRSSNASGPVRPGEYVRHSIIIENKGETFLNKVFVEDKIKNPSGQEEGSLLWQIGSMNRGDKFRIDYDLLVNNPGSEGSYTYVAQAFGLSGKDEVESRKVSDALRILGFWQVAQASVFSENPEDLFAGEASSRGIDEVSGQVQGQDDLICQSRPLPFWIFFLAVYGAVFYGATLYSSREKSGRRSFSWKEQSATAVLGIGGWYFLDECRQYPWVVPAILILSVAIYLLGRYYFSRGGEKVPKEIV